MMNLRKFYNELLDKYNEIIEIKDSTECYVAWSGEAAKSGYTEALRIFAPCSLKTFQIKAISNIHSRDEVIIVQPNGGNCLRVLATTFSFLHEIGHLKTTTTKILLAYNDNVIKTRELDGQKRRIAYRQIEAEYLADEWALNEINTNLEWLLQLERECGVNE